MIAPITSGLARRRARVAIGVGDNLLESLGKVELEGMMAPGFGFGGKTG
jgi:hypothetical protein